MPRSVPGLISSVTTQPQLIRKSERGEQRCFSPLNDVFWAVGPSALPCAGAAPPQRPPTKPSLTDRVHSSQRVGWRAWRRLYTSCVTKSLNASKEDWLVNCCGLVVTLQQTRKCHSLLAFGRSGLRPSLVQGLRPRNAPPWLATLFTLPRNVSSQQCLLPYLPSRATAHHPIESVCTPLPHPSPQSSCRGRPCACPVLLQKPAHIITHRRRPFHTRPFHPKTGMHTPRGLPLLRRSNLPKTTGPSAPEKFTCAQPPPSRIL